MKHVFLVKHGVIKEDTGKASFYNDTIFSTLAKVKSTLKEEAQELKAIEHTTEIISDTLTKIKIKYWRGGSIVTRVYKVIKKEIFK